MSAFTGWEAQVLRAIGAPMTQQNFLALKAWQQAEGGSAAFNPLNTTQPAPGASKYNGVGVRNFTSKQQGIHATAQTLLNGHYGDIVKLLRSGKATAQQVGTAVAQSPWGTGSGVLRVLGSPPVQADHAGSGAVVGGKPEQSFGPPLVGQSLKSMAAAVLLQQSAMTAAGGQPDSSGLLALAAARQQVQAAQTTFGPQTTKDALIPKAAGSGGINELFYDPLGGIKNGKQIGAIGGHGDHVHIALGSRSAQVAAIKQAQAMGLRVGEDMDSNVHPVHAEHSYHYRKFGGGLRQAADVSGDPSQMAAYYRWVQSHYA